MVRVLGIPYDASSSFLRGPAKGPAAILEALNSPSANMWSESGVDLGPEGAGSGWDVIAPIEFVPAGGTPWDGSQGSAAVREVEREEITTRVRAELSEGHRLLSLGGDHSVSLPILRAYAERYPDLTVVQLDAHADLYPVFEGDRFSHACPFARGMEEGLASRLVQIGVRTLTRAQEEVSERFGVETHRLRGSEPVLPALEGPVYLTLDLDVLDPAFAPGVSHHEPGGLSTRAVLDLLQGLTGRLVGADIVELNPDRDVNDVTAMVAAKFAREILALLVRP